jgi:hypothetical protein
VRLDAGSRPTSELTAKRAGQHLDLLALALILAWIGLVLLAASVPVPDGGELARQLVLGMATWGVLVVLLRRQTPLVRVQTLVVIALATCVEYTFSPLLQAYTYAIGTVPLFVPPGHGLVYLAALTLGRNPLVGRHRRPLVVLTVFAGGAWAAAGVLGLGGRHDVLGAFWFACLLGFLAWGPNRSLYVGAFVVVSYLELAGTALGVWAWAPVDPVLHVIGQGSPPSGAAGGYGWFDLWALLLAPRLLAGWRSVRDLVEPRDTRPQDAKALSTASCSKPFVATAPAPNGPSSPSREVNRPPASTTTGTSAAMS